MSLWLKDSCCHAIIGMVNAKQKKYLFKPILSLDWGWVQVESTMPRDQSSTDVPVHCKGSRAHASLQ